MHRPREEVGGGVGDKWPGLTLKITSSTGIKQLNLYHLTHDNITLCYPLFPRMTPT